MWTLLCLLSSVCAIMQHYIWTSTAYFRTPTTLDILNAACYSEGQGSAVVCTPLQNVTNMFPESATVLNKGGLTVAASSSVYNTLFVNGISVTIPYYNGNPVQPTPSPSASAPTSVASGCTRLGIYDNTYSCSNWTDTQSTNRGFGNPLTLTTNTGWLFSTVASCTSNFRVYCLASQSTTSPPTTPSVNSIPPSMSSTSASPTAPDNGITPSTAPGQTSKPTTAAPTLLPTLRPSTAQPSSPAIVRNVTSPPSSPTTPPSRTPSNTPSNTPTKAPTNLPASSPTDAVLTATPTVARAAPLTSRPTSQPTLVPTCGTCSQTLNITGENQNVTVGPPGNPVVVIVPGSLLQNSSSKNGTTTIVFVVTPTSSKPPTSQVFGSDSVITIDIKDDGITRSHPTPLDVPIQFLMPSSAAALDCPAQPQCVWWDGTQWSSSGCNATAVDRGTICTCSHLTDFAVLLDQSAVMGCHKVQSVTVYYPFVVFYGLIFLYCVWAVLLLLKGRTVKEKHSMLLLQHTLIGAVAVLRILSGLRFLGMFGGNLILTAFLTAAPYPLEYWLFTRLASTWAGLVHYSLLTSAARWTKIRPLFWSLNVLGTGLAVAMFVLFAKETTFEVAVAGTAVLSVLYLALAVAFNVYAYRLLKELDKASSSSASSRSIIKKSSCCDVGVSGKIRWTGRIATMSFVVQAFSNVMSIATAADELVFWTAVFLLCNVIALTCLLMVYYAALAKALWGQNTFTSSPQLLKQADSSGKSGSFMTDRGSGVDLQNLTNHESQLSSAPSEDSSSQHGGL